MWLAAVQVAVVAIVAIGALLWAGEISEFAAGTRRVVASPTLLVQCLLLAMIGTAATFTFQTWAQHHMSETHAAIIFTLEPVFAAALAAWLLAERMTGRGWAGGAFVLAGIAISELKLRRS